MMELVTKGHSWSGRERHVCYLNEGTGRFANVSAVSGIDFPDDGRALGFVDWDDDGDLDVWLRNRTAPRLRFLQNDIQSEAHTVMLTLEGRTCNRDAIGAVVEMRVAGQPGLLSRSVKAGDLFLSQSSKRLHFGLGNASPPEKVRVLWPGQTSWEVVEGITGTGHYHLRQGDRRAEIKEVLTRPEQMGGALMPGPTSARAVARLPVPIPLLPSFRYRDQAMQRKPLPNAAKSRLIVLWSSACPACVRSLPALRGLADDRFSVLALCVDPVEQAQDAYAFMETVAWPHPWGFLEPDMVAKLDLFQSAPFDRAIPLATPTAFLVNAQQDVLAIYRGLEDAERIREDAATLPAMDDESRHHLAPPFAGRWFTNPVPPGFVMEDVARRLQERFPEDALPYLHLAYEQAQTAAKKEALRLELGARHQQWAQQAAESGSPKQAQAAFAQAVRYLPESAALHHNYGVFLAEYGQEDGARQLLQRALQLKPDSEATQAALRLLEQRAD